MSKSRSCFSVGSIDIGQQKPLMLIAGPCMMESADHAFEVAHALDEICRAVGMGWIFKSSFDKANRTSLQSPRGVSLSVAMGAFERIRSSLGIPVITDVHHPEQCPELSSCVDVLQIPALLCRQTDLVMAAAKTSCALNIKKGQFLAPSDMRYVVDKAHSAGNDRVMVCERGTSFGYHTLVNDMRSLRTMAAMGIPVIFDGTHSVQEPGGARGKSGGRREFVEPLSRAAVSIGVAGVFLETHPNPDVAPSDGPNMVPISQMKPLLETLMAFDKLAKTCSYAPIA